MADDLLVIDLPPGVYANGTDLQAAGRWREASLIRWRQGAMMPVGGWRERFDSLTGDTPAGIPRGALAWVDNTSGKNLAWASYSGLFHVTTGGTVTDITPTGLTVGDEMATEKSGYGMGLYGASTYGTPRLTTGDYADVTTWSLDTWGEYLLGVSTADQTLYEWDLVSAEAAAVSNAPTCTGCVVTSERFVFALEAGGEPNRVEWCDREDNTTWTAAATNEAGGYTLQTSGRIMQGLRVRGQTLLLTDTDAWAATYVGQPFVYGFERVGSGCGVASRRAAATTPFGAIWLGDNGFFRYDGGAVEPVECDVLDDLLSALNSARVSQAFAVTNSMFDEVWWFYASEESTECDSYVAYNYREGHWATGSLARTAGFDRGVFNYPVLLSSDAVVYDHEFQTLAEDGMAFAESGPIMYNRGDKVVTVTEVIPDQEAVGEVTAKLMTRYYPNGDETVSPPVELTNPTSVRVSGRQFRLRIDGKANKDFRVGVQRCRISVRGDR